MQSQTLSSVLRRLIAVDAALASPEGLHIGTLAAEFNVDQKTIRRDVAALAEIVGPTVHRQVETADNAVGRTVRHWHQDRRRRMFSPWLGGAAVPVSGRH